MQEFYAIVTNKGKEKEMECLDGNSAFDIWEIGIGDGNGSSYEPKETQTALKNEKWRGRITRCENEDGSIGTRYAVINIPANIAAQTGEFTIREIGAFDKAGNLILIGKCAPNKIRNSETGDIKQLSYRFDLSILNELVLPFLIDPSVNSPSIAYIEENFQKLDERGAINGYAPLDTNKMLPLLHLTDFVKFTVNIGTYDNSDEPDLLSLENNNIKVKGTFTYTEANGKTHTVSDILTLDITDIESGEYDICVSENNGSYILSLDNLTIDTKNPPYLAYDKLGALTNKVPLGKIEISSGNGGKLSVNKYNTRYNSRQTLDLYPKIGDPIRTLSNVLNENEIWLEGAEVSRETYSALFEIYGTTYGAGDGKTTFKLPDYRNRTVWGKGADGAFGYIEAGLPAHTHTITRNIRGGGSAQTQGNGVWSSDTGTSSGTATNYTSGASNAIYGKSTTVQPPAIKERVKTRYA